MKPEYKKYQSMSNEDASKIYHLLPCPFCGGTPSFNNTVTSCKSTIKLNGTDKFWGVSCQRCSQGSRYGSPTPLTMADLWNKRIGSVSVPTAGANPIDDCAAASQSNTLATDVIRRSSQSTCSAADHIPDFGCKFPGKCCMPADHFESECHTAEDIDNLNQEIK